MLRLRIVNQFQRKIGSSPQIGRDVVKIRWTYGDNIFSCGGHPRSDNAKQGTADESQST
jgi:hypothetical protein